MAEESELEKRAVEELLRETNRARVRAETMGPAGWMKCPLKSTNKRFLLNTLRSSGLPRRTAGQPDEGRPSARGHRGGQLPPRSRSRSRSHSRTPPRDRRDHTRRHRDGSNRRRERPDANGQEGSGRDRDARAEAHRLQPVGPSPSEAFPPSGSHSLPGEGRHSPRSGDSLSSGSPSPGHAHRPHGGGPRSHCSSPAQDKPSGRRGK